MCHQRRKAELTQNRTTGKGSPSNLVTAIWRIVWSSGNDTSPYWQMCHGNNSYQTHRGAPVTTGAIRRVVCRPTEREDIPTVPDLPRYSSWCYAVELRIPVNGNQFPSSSIANNKSTNEDRWQIESILGSYTYGVAQLAMPLQCQLEAAAP